MPSLNVYHQGYLYVNFFVSIFLSCVYHIHRKKTRNIFKRTGLQASLSSNPSNGKNYSRTHQFHQSQ